jgi:hypothetical protein
VTVCDEKFITGIPPPDSEMEAIGTPENGVKLNVPDTVPVPDVVPLTYTVSL